MKAESFETLTVEDVAVLLHEDVTSEPLSLYRLQPANVLRTVNAAYQGPSSASWRSRIAPFRWPCVSPAQAPRHRRSTHCRCAAPTAW